MTSTPEHHTNHICLQISRNAGNRRGAQCNRPLQPGHHPLTSRGSGAAAPHVLGGTRRPGAAAKSITPKPTTPQLRRSRLSVKTTVPVRQVAPPPTAASERVPRFLRDKRTLGLPERAERSGPVRSGPVRSLSIRRPGSAQVRG